MANVEGSSRDELVGRICKQLAFDFGDQFPEETIHQYVSESLDTLRDARVQTFIPLLIQRSVMQRLKDAAKPLPDEAVAGPASPAA